MPEMSNREIDALVAEHIYSWADIYRMNNVHGLAGHPPGTDHMAAQVVPHYSTDPAASKQLRDKMRADGWEYAIRTATNQGSQYSAEVYRLPVTLETYFDYYADTEEMAVARAALKAVGVQQEER